MNNSAPQPDQDNVQGTGQPVAPVLQHDPVNPASPPNIASVSGQPGKEYEPGQSLSEYATLPGSELEPSISPELKDAGVEAAPNTERPTLTIEDKRLGIEHGADALSHPMTTPGSKPLPMTKADAKAIVDNNKIGWLDSLKGFALNMFRQNEKKEMQH